MTGEGLGHYKNLCPKVSLHDREGSGIYDTVLDAGWMLCAKKHPNVTQVMFAKTLVHMITYKKL